MAITGAAAIAGAAAAGLGVSATVIAVAGLAITAVGFITKNQTLMKIGGGIGLGGAAAGLASGLASGATAGAADTTQAAINAPSVADAAGAGSQAAGNVAEAAATSTPSDLIAGYSGSSGLVDGAAAGVQNASEAAVSQAGAPLGAGSSGGAVAPVDTSLSGAGNNTVANNIASQSPAQQAVQQSTAAANVNPVNTNPANVNAANINPTNAATATTGSGAPYGFDSSTAYTPVTNGLQNPSSWWQDAQSWFGNPKNNGVMQLGGGLVKGIGQGVGAAIQASGAQKMTDQQKFEQANMSGAAAIPTVNVQPSGSASPYKSPTQIQQAANAAVQSTTTPAYKKGLVNGNRS